MAAASFFRAFYLSYLSKPPSDRILYRIIQRYKARRILELGVGSAQRAVRMIEMAQRRAPGRQITYTGTDLFESREPAHAPGVTLKWAYQILGATGARIHLVPGDPFSALARAANSLMGTDLVVISAREDPQSVDQAWFYLPRVLHARSRVVAEEIRPGAGTTMRVLGASEIERLTRANALRRAA